MISLLHRPLSAERDTIFMSRISLSPLFKIRIQFRVDSFMFSIFDISYYCYRHVYKLSNLYWFCLTGNVGECVTSPVLSHCNKNWKWWTDQCYSYMLQLSFIWQAQENASLRHEGGPTQKTRGEEKNPPHPSSVLAPLFMCVCVCAFFFFFPPPPEHSLYKLG